MQRLLATACPHSDPQCLPPIQRQQEQSAGKTYISKGNLMESKTPFLAIYQADEAKGKGLHVELLLGVVG
jgi:hypothetical protein